jgi:putative DNA primase/helicase
MPVITRHPVRAIPKELRTLQQWVCWRLEERDGKPTKVPSQPNGASVSTTDPTTWSSLGACLQALQTRNFLGIGYVFSPYDNNAGIDLVLLR